jgi:flagellar export protein FliJ
MKKSSLDILYRYRKHLLEKEQIALQDKIADENQQKARLLQLQARVQATHEAKLGARSVEEMRALDDAAAYLHGRITMAKRAVTITTQAREDAMNSTLKSKQARDQVGLLIDNDRTEHRRAIDESERKQIDEMVTSRYAIAFEAL